MSGVARIRRPRIARRIPIAILALACALGSTAALGPVAGAASTQAGLDAARAQLDSLNRKLDVLVEQYDQTNVAVRDTEARLARQRVVTAQAQAESERMRATLSARAAAAYEGGAGSELEVVLGATNLADLTDRLEFVNSIVRSDAQLAEAAQAARIKAASAAATLSSLAKRRQDQLESLGRKKGEIESSIVEQQSLVDELKTNLAQERAAAAAANERPASTARGSKAGGEGGGGPSPRPSPTHPAPSPSPTGGGGGGGGGGGPGPDPRASTAVQAAFSVIGVPYQWGGADPETGFDCSGLTMWAWAQAGVTLPHSSALQYDSIPHVAKADLQPGDLLFFYTPISHVSIYVGGGMQIDAPHAGAVVQEVPVYWASFVGAGRP